MSATLTAEIYQDAIAVTLANVFTTANQRAREMGVDVAESMLTITQRIKRSAKGVTAFTQANRASGAPETGTTGERSLRAQS